MRELNELESWLKRELEYSKAKRTAVEGNIVKYSWLDGYCSMTKTALESVQTLIAAGKYSGDQIDTWEHEEP